MSECPNCKKLEQQVFDLRVMLMESGAQRVQLEFDTNAIFHMNDQQYSVHAGDTVNVVVQGMVYEKSN